MFRGVAIAQRVTCMGLDSPASFNIQVIPPAPDPTVTTRERYDVHVRDSICAGCHDVIDPFGFAFEHYDGMGAYRDLDHGKSVDSAVDVSVGRDFDGHYADSNQLAAALAESPNVRECFARFMFRALAGDGRRRRHARRRGVHRRLARDTGHRRGQHRRDADQRRHERRASPCGARHEDGRSPHVPPWARRRGRGPAVRSPGRKLARRRGWSGAAIEVHRHLPSSRHRGRALHDARRRHAKRASTSAIRIARCSPSTIPPPTDEASRTRSSSSKASTSCRIRTPTTPRARSSPAAASSAATGACPGTAPWISSWRSSSGSATPRWSPASRSPSAASN